MEFKKIALSTLLVVSSLALFTNCSQNSSATKASGKTPSKSDTTKKVASEDTVPQTVVYKPINHAEYDSLVKKNVHGDTSGLWPVKNAPYPLPGAILPYKRVVAFYGNLYSKKMGILGELPPNEMLAKLKGEVKTLGERPILKHRCNRLYTTLPL